MQTLLSSACCGTKGVITSLDDHKPGTKQLRRLGIHEGMPIEVLHGPDPVIVLCHRSKIAVSRTSLEAVTISVQNHSCGCYFLASFFDLFRFKSTKPAANNNEISE
jgi:Fe2+ transport system protein FeoA